MKRDLAITTVAVATTALVALSSFATQTHAFSLSDIQIPKFEKSSFTRVLGKPVKH